VPAGVASTATVLVVPKSTPSRKPDPATSPTLITPRPYL
jgi:hypothetical protein